MTGIGPVAVRQPRVREREVVGGGRIRFGPTILPPYARHACVSLPMLRDPVSGRRLVSSRHRINGNFPDRACAFVRRRRASAWFARRGTAARLQMIDREKKRAPRGARFQYAGVGAGNFQRGTCCAPATLGGYTSGATASPQYASRSAAQQRFEPHDCHAYALSAGHGRKKRDFRGGSDRGLRAHMGEIDGGADHFGVFEGVSIFFAARGQPHHQVADRGDARRGSRHLPQVCRRARTPRQNNAVSYSLRSFPRKRESSRDSPDGSRTVINTRVFPASPQDRSEVRIATVTSGSPGVSRWADLAIFAGIWTHSSHL